jgi:hypothetical protein
MSEKKNDTFEWYKLLVEQGRWEAEYGWKRLETTIKFHLSVAAGLVALGAFAVYTRSVDLKVILLALLIAGCGVYSAVMLWKALWSSAGWEGRFFGAAANVEATSAFKEAVGIDDIQVWSKPGIREHMDPEVKKGSPSRGLQYSVVNGFIAFYIVFFLGLVAIASGFLSAILPGF